MGAAASNAEDFLSASARNKGRYYSTIDDVWDPIPSGFGPADWQNLRRTPAEVRRIPEYNDVLAGMEVNDDPALGLSRSASIESTIPDATRMPGMPIGKGAQGAHFVPHNKTCAVAFGPVAEMALGQNLQGDNQKTRKRHRLVVGVMEQKGSKRQKRANTGLKHNELNKMRIKHQKEYMENRPCLLIVPLLSLQETKAWNSGDPYSALLCAGGYDGGTAILNVSSVAVYRETLIDFLPQCTRPELDVATSLLSDFTKGLAQSLSTSECFDLWETNPAEKAKLEDVRNKLNGQVNIPALRARRLFHQLRVAKVRLDSNDDDLPNPPDPFLLVLKAAIIWSWRNGQKLLPGCFIPEEDELSDSDDRELQQLQHEQEERKRQESIRPSDHLKVARGLGLDVDETTVFKVD